MIPPDLTQCQALKPNGFTFMTLGGVPGHVRCREVPTYIAIEKEAGKDGNVGSMSLCAECREVMEKQMPDYAIFTSIEKSAGLHGENAEPEPHEWIADKASDALA